MVASSLNQRTLSTMKLSAFKQQLSTHPDQGIGFVFDDGELIPEHFHITEVGHVAKHFIDCGAAMRKVECVQLQVWLGNDKDHRLTAGRLTKIIDLAKPLLPSDELEVEVEYEGCVISQYTIEGTLNTGRLLFQLADKHTDCLAKEACAIEAAGTASRSCGGSTNCC